MCTLNKSKALMAFSNFLLLVCGGILATGGILIIFDTERVLLSKVLSTDTLGAGNLPHPVLYYVALGIVMLGFSLAGVGVLGCWASCLHSYCFLIIYILIIMGLLVGECAVYTVLWIWPSCLGMELRVNELIRSLKKNYGTAGNEQFTVAVDLIQKTYRCCGILSSDEYETSLWHLQDLGPKPKLSVPLSCCVLRNFVEPQSYLDPHPRNTSLCQALEINNHEQYRHNRGCFSYIEEWYTQHLFVFLLTGLAIVLMEFLVLLSTILAFTRLCQSRNTKRAFEEVVEPEQPQPRITENIYHTSIPNLNRTFRQHYKT
ncbi:tetraspanin-11 [Agrilus planipennis]|uniref:Tetraspanin-11 n=1 Tax=Agrilus planipennis TaxID=224129 RepID=A0A1W4XDW9_AGRPL|nr:tetraspanin-11 [Agrilus planipennis]